PPLAPRLGSPPPAPRAACRARPRLRRRPRRLRPRLLDAPARRRPDPDGARHPGRLAPRSRRPGDDPGPPGRRRRAGPRSGSARRVGAPRPPDGRSETRPRAVFALGGRAALAGGAAVGAVGRRRHHRPALGPDRGPGLRSDGPAVVGDRPCRQRPGWAAAGARLHRPGGRGGAGERLRPLRGRPRPAGRGAVRGPRPARCPGAVGRRRSTGGGPDAPAGPDHDHGDPGRRLVPRAGAGVRVVGHPRLGLAGAVAGRGRPGGARLVGGTGRGRGPGGAGRTAPRRTGLVVPDGVPGGRIVRRRRARPPAAGGAGPRRQRRRDRPGRDRAAGHRVEHVRQEHPAPRDRRQRRAGQRGRTRLRRIAAVAPGRPLDQRPGPGLAGARGFLFHGRAAAPEADRRRRERRPAPTQPPPAVPVGRDPDRHQHGRAPGGRRPDRRSPGRRRRAGRGLDPRPGPGRRRPPARLAAPGPLRRSVHPRPRRPEHDIRLHPPPRRRDLDQRADADGAGGAESGRI
ncbi:MAG: MutS-related protein, family 1, partial [uncultured Thermomicrobiales bacterium]